MWDRRKAPICAFSRKSAGWQLPYESYWIFLLCFLQHWKDSVKFHFLVIEVWICPGIVKFFPRLPVRALDLISPCLFGSGFFSSAAFQ